MVEAKEDEKEVEKEMGNRVAREEMVGVPVEMGVNVVVTMAKVVVDAMAEDVKEVD